MYEYEATIPTLWGHVLGTSSAILFYFSQFDDELHPTNIDFAKEHPEYIAQDNSMGFMTGDGEKYNLCHCQYNSPLFSCHLVVVDTSAGSLVEL
jgi:alpha 1,2-mannosyltransferase